MSINTDEERERADRLQVGEVRPGDKVLFIGYPGVDHNDQFIGEHATVISVSTGSVGIEILQIDPLIGTLLYWNSCYFKKLNRTRKAPERHACRCSMHTLMVTGCKCGGV
jgi:hypothetical protein